MTEEQAKAYVEWLDYQIKSSRKVYEDMNPRYQQARAKYKGEAFALEAAREKFLSLQEKDK